MVYSVPPNNQKRVNMCEKLSTGERQQIIMFDGGLITSPPWCTARNPWVVDMAYAPQAAFSGEKVRRCRDRAGGLAKGADALSTSQIEKKGISCA